MRIVALHLYFCGAVLISQSYGQEADMSALEARLRKEAPLAWRRLEAKHRETRFDWKQTEINNSRDEQKVRTASGSNCYRGVDFVIHIEENGGTGTKVWGGNDRYLFTVTRKSGDQSWALGHFGPRADDPARNGDWGLGVHTRIPWCFSDVPCHVLMADPSFKIQSLEKKSDGSVDLRFSISPQKEHDRNPQLTSGHVVLLPDRDWAISSYEANLTGPTHAKDSPVVVSASATYGPEEDRFLNLKHSKYELRWQDVGKQREDKWDTDLTCQHCAEPVESFSLASFGLSEPALPSEATTKSRLWLWLNVVAIVCLLVALILRSRLKAREQ